MISDHDLRKELSIFRKPIECANSIYTSRNSSKGALLTEAMTLFSFLARNNSLASAREAVIQDDLFIKKAYQTRKKCWAILHSRYFPARVEFSGDMANRDYSECNHPIIALFRAHASETMKKGVLYYHFATSDLFTYEATVELVYDLYSKGLTNLASRDVHKFLDSKKKSHPEINNWSPQTCSSLVSHYLSAMRDFGILKGKVQKKIYRPTVEEDLFLYVVVYLRDCGKSPKDILASDDFKLFLLSRQEVEARLRESQRRHRIRFLRSGSIVSLELPWRSIYEYIENIGD